MADISAITSLDGVTYSIKDSEAREHLVPSAGTTGQVLTKTSSGYGWADVEGGGNVDTVNNIQPDANKNVQTQVELTQAQYDALPSSKLTDNVEYFITDGSTSYPTADEVRYEEGVSVADALDTLNAGLIPVLTGTWTPSMPRNSITTTTSNWILQGNIMYFYWVGRISSGSGNSYIDRASFTNAIPEGYQLLSPITGTWESDSDKGGTLGMAVMTGNVWFSSGDHLTLPNNTLAFNATCLVEKTSS